ncbi:MAG TPA: ATP-binding protein [Candidatus Saccharimonadales bacterium]|nr:ATP-binding protein [Candidatus Saccharimonadales bacterium]
MKITQKFILLMLSIGLVPTLVVSAVAYVTISRELTGKTISQVTSLATKQESKVDSLLQSEKEDFIKFANLYTLQTDLNAYAGGSKAAANDITSILYAKKTDDSGLAALYLTDLQNKTIATTAPFVGGKPFDIVSVLGHAPSQQAGVFFSLQEDNSDGLNKLFVTSVISINQKPVAVLTAAIRLDDLLAAVEDYTGLDSTGETVIAARQGDKYISLFPLRFDTNAALKRDVSGLNFSGAQDQSYISTVDYRGKKVIEVIKNVPITNWSLATKIDKDEALHPIVRLGDSVLLIVLTSSLVIIIASMYFARVLTSPIVTLTDKTRKIMGGDFSQRILVKSKDEIGTMAATFNAMADKLAESYAALEQKVVARTQSLNQKVQELSDAKAKDDAILSSVGEGMIVTDSAGNILLVNELAAQLLGIGLDGVVGKPLSANIIELGGEHPIPPEQRPVEVALRTGQKTTQQVRSVWPDGQKRVLGITATPVQQQGKIIGTIQILRDMTREKEIDRMKTEFISLASHQLRTPLSAIRWFSEMLISGDAGPLNEQQKEFAQNVYDSTERMTQLVGSLLNISRIESGRIRIDPQPTDLKTLVTGIVNDLKGKTEERQQTIVVSVHADLPKVSLDPRLIGQVYLNLLTNAIKYSPKGGEISVFVSRKDDQLVSQVTDSGYGIPLAEQAKMFQKFFRATNVAKVETDGTGLGMYLVKSIIESSGGKIWFKSEEGKGTTFWFSLPMSGMRAKEGEVTID